MDWMSSTLLSQSPDEDSLSSDTKGGETHGLDVLDAFVSIP